MSHHLLHSFELSLTKPHGSFLHLAVYLDFHSSLAALIINLGALRCFQLLPPFINPVPWSQILTLPVRSCTNPVFYFCIIWKSSSMLLVFAKYDSVLQDSFPLPSGASLYFRILRRLHLFYLLCTCTCSIYYVSGTTIGSGDIAVKKVDINPCPHGAYAVAITNSITSMIWHGFHKAILILPPTKNFASYRWSLNHIQNQIFIRTGQMMGDPYQIWSEHPY